MNRFWWWRPAECRPARKLPIIRGQQRLWRSALATLMMLSVIVSTVANLPAILAAGTPTAGIMVLNQRTLPRGAVWLDGTLGGHLWITDQIQGICRVDSLPGANPPWQATNCNAAAKSGGQVIVGNLPATPPAGTPAGAKYVYVADHSTRSNQVVRFVFNPSNETLQTPLIMDVIPVTVSGGGGGGGRPVGLALAPNGADLYVGYLKSGDIMKVTGAQTATNNRPQVDKVGSTSDGKGLNALVLFGNDLYLAELGGFGFSTIADPAGLTRTACSATAQCTAAHPNPLPSSFPGGLATDGTFIYIGDAPRANVNSILRYNPATGTVDSYSTTVPAYTATFDGKTYTQYEAPYGLGLAPNGDLYVGDDPTFGLPLPGQAAPATVQGHIWKVPAAANPLAVTSISPNNGTTAGGTLVTINGTGFSTAAGATTVNFGANAGTTVSCTTTTCTANSPAGSGTVDVRVSVGGQFSPTGAADQFTYVAPPSTTGIAVAGVAPNSGATTGGTPVTITGQNLATVGANGAVTGQPTVSFGANAATNVLCTSATTCTATSPAGTAGVVDVQVTLGTNTSAANPPADQFTYVTPTASLYAWGITAPKGGAVWLPNSAGGGHWWSSDHAQGLCRQDPVPNTKLHAINFAVCGDDLVGSAGQAAYDPRPNPNGTHYVYVPDNAVKSTAVWRLTFDPVNEVMVPDPLGGAMATAMTPLADVRTLKPNGMALGPLKADSTLDTASPAFGLYVSDLTEANIRIITNPSADPRTQAISIVAQTGDLRGANGTQGFIGKQLYISENRGTSFFDVTQCPLASGPCGTIKIPMNVAPAGVFVAGTAVDPIHKLVYASDSPGGAAAGVYRYDASKDAYVAFLAGSAGANPNCDPNNSARPAGCAVGAPAQLYITGGTLPAAGTPETTVQCALTCVRPWDFAHHPTMGATTGFAFAFGLATNPNGDLVITEDPTAGARSGRGTMWMVPFVP